MFQGRPIIGIAGGIGSGKSFVARLFGEMGCCVIHADEQIRQAYTDPAIQGTLRDWWGPDIYKPDGTVDKAAIARRIFSNEPDRLRLEQLLHPWIAKERDRIMATAAQKPGVLAFVWDTPLLFEAGLERECDAVVFVEAPRELRLQRLMQTRGWTEDEMNRREKLQQGLDKKRKAAHYMVVNTAEAADGRSQVREVLSRILAN
jgi:dephospho-CoA kinase